jgi:3-dehydroquinate synthase II
LILTKEVWLRLNPDNSEAQKVELLKMAEGRCNVVVLSPNDIPLASGLKLQTASSDERSDIRLLQTPLKSDKGLSRRSAVEVVVKERSDEDKVLKLAESGVGYVLVRCPNWKIIPLENLIARTRKKVTLLADVASAAEAKTALETLELGVDGVVIAPSSTKDLDELDRFLNHDESVPLIKAKVVAVREIGSGARVCVDTCELMQPGEGMLVGSQSSGLFLVEAEVHKNPHVEPRPFRVNAGPVSSYVLTPGLKTRYLAELKTGEEILIVNRSGASRNGHVGRVKIERRPMVLVEAEAADHSFSLIVQNAETVRLISDASSKPVSELKAGDEILVRVEEGGRHFGTLVADEMVIER